MATQFITKKYFQVHGKQPKGRGAWAFAFNIPNDPQLRQTIFVTPSLTLTEAKKYARQQYPNIKYFYVLG